MFESSDVPAPDIQVPAVSKRQNALAGIVEMKTPVIKSKRVPAPAKVFTSDDFRPKENSKGTCMPGCISEKELGCVCVRGGEQQNRCACI